MQMATENNFPEVPVHPLSALVTIAVDLFWGTLGVFLTATFVGVLLVIITSALAFIFTFFAVFFVQKFIAEDRVGPSFAKGLAMSVLAGVPYPIAGTVVGTALLGWAGLDYVRNPTLPTTIVRDESIMVANATLELDEGNQQSS